MRSGASDVHRGGNGGGMRRIGRVPEASGATFADLIRVRVFMVDLGQFEHTVVPHNNTHMQSTSSTPRSG